MSSSCRMEEDLIEHVRVYPILYDPMYKGYKNQQIRLEAWEQIGIEMGISGNDCKDMWTKLRNAYTNAIKRRITKPGQSAKNIMKWKYEDEMSFLRRTFKSRSTHEDLDYIKLEEADPDYPPGFDLEAYAITTRSFISPNASPLPPLSPATISPPPADLNPAKRVKREASMSDIIQDNSGMRSENLPLQPASTKHNFGIDDTEMFLLSFGASIKRLSREEQSRVKMEICKTVFEAEMRDIKRSKQLLQNEPSSSRSTVPHNPTTNTPNTYNSMEDDNI